MTTRGFTLAAHVPAAGVDVIDFLAAIEGHRGLHPFLESAEVVDRGVGSDGPWQEYRVVERPSLGPFRYRVRFPATVVRTSPTALRSEVRLTGCHLASTTTATDEPGGCRVEEHTVVTSPQLLVGYVARQARRAHARTLAGLADQPWVRR
ncbi:hypothetical protein [Nocardioides taihuensis]|uniref:SRPBCC family protein n=1 Tax=Nocardioides taihuensis TaxID=1835606 RepID=A0ABW0BFL6_9ACTN